MRHQGGEVKKKLTIIVGKTEEMGDLGNNFSINQSNKKYFLQPVNRNLMHGH